MLNTKVAGLTGGINMINSMILLHLEHYESTADSFSPLGVHSQLQESPQHQAPTTSQLQQKPRARTI